MGVDAEMFVRIKGRENWLNEDQVRRLSYDLASTIGHDHFFIQQVDEQKPFGPPHHALTIIKPYGQAEYEDGYPDLKGKVVWLQDGDPIFAEEGEQFILVHLYTRYYGEGYERGNWLVIRTTAEFLEQALSGSQVWYGGDSAGILAEPFDAVARAKLHRHWLSNGRRPYARAFTPFGDSRPAPECPTCKVPMFSTGGGQGQSFWSCDGCGREEIRQSDGKRVRVPRGKEFFDVSRDPSLGVPVQDSAP